jgi:hypothetical protein
MRSLNLLFCLVVLAGCSSAPQVRSEYFDVTGRIFAPKHEAQEVRLYPANADPGVAYEETGRVNVWGPLKTSREAIDAELKKRTRQAGADALIDVQYSSDKADELVLFGKVLSKKKYASATGRTVVLKEAPVSEQAGP